MKNQSDLSTLTTEELEKKAKSTKFVTGLLVGSIIVQFTAGVYLTVINGFNLFLIIPVAFLPLISLNFTNLKKIKEEIEKRKI